MNLVGSAALVFSVEWAGRPGGGGLAGLLEALRDG